MNKQLLKFYNPIYIIKIKEQTAFTGGMTDSGKVLPMGEEIIKQKISAVFFSEINSFVIPKCEEAAAQSQLKELNKNYPSRKLKLIPVEDIKDVLNRRDVIDIRKQKLVVRTGKFVKKNWVSAVVTGLLTIFLSYFFVVYWVIIRQCFHLMAAIYSLKIRMIRFCGEKIFLWLRM